MLSKKRRGEIALLVLKDRISTEGGMTLRDCTKPKTEKLAERIGITPKEASEFMGELLVNIVKGD